MKTSIKVILLFIACVMGCNKEENSILREERTKKITFSNIGIINSTLDKNGSLRSMDGLKVKNNYTVHDGLESNTSFYCVSYKLDKNKLSATDLVAGTTKMEEGIRYRILIYELDDEGAEHYYEQIDLVCDYDDPDGESVEVVLGGQYTWYAYSYNDNAVMDPITDYDNPVVSMGVNKDFIYTQGYVEITEDFQSVDIILNVKQLS
jgi:hypothetical protein